MKVLVTGSGGFIGKNLVARLRRMDDVEILTHEKGDDESDLCRGLEAADFIYHLAGVNRPDDPEEFYRGNRDLTHRIVEILQEKGKKTPILFTSSIQVERENDYGLSKKAAEEVLADYAEKSGATLFIYRLPNVFGKWSRPNYNTVIATWCHNLARDLPIEISDENVELSLVYIDDVVDHFLRHLDDEVAKGVVYPHISPVYRKSLGEIRDLLQAFKTSRSTLVIPRVGRGFERALYATWLSFLPPEKFSYPLDGHRDERGTFYEFLKTMDSGQFSLSTTAPGVTRGNHFHHTKNEKFLVVKGRASIKMRQLFTDEVIEFTVGDDRMEVVEMIPGYTHDITNIGEEEMILMLWSNEIFDPEHPDTYYEKV